MEHDKTLRVIPPAIDHHRLLKKHMKDRFLDTYEKPNTQPAEPPLLVARYAEGHHTLVPGLLAMCNKKCGTFGKTTNDAHSC